ncbi:MAG: dihydroorotase [Lachnospiraceae bacterium]|nr:dihydroorotase [Lachnospiraceae bacterium]
MILIKNGHVIDPKSNMDGIYDILMNEGKIVEIGTNITSVKSDCIDASGLCVAPGLIDVHVHFRDPGFTHKETIETGAHAAKAGGFTSVVCMANTKPVVDNLETLRYVCEEGRKTGIHVYQAGAVTKGLQGKEMTEMSEMKRAGAAGFTDDGIPLMDEQLVRRVMEEAVRLDVPLSFHEENPCLIINNGINADNETSAAGRLGIGGSPRIAEIDLIQRDLELALEIGASINIQHISSKEGVELVRKAKKKGNHIHAEATPHHFTLTEEAVLSKGTLAKMNPPLRTEKDRLAIIEGLKDGTIDIIATDHAPHAKEEKEKPLTEAPSGIIGLETALALGITNLVEKGHLSMIELIRKMTINPAILYHLNAGYIAKDGPADLVIFDPKEQWQVETFASKSCNSPFVGEVLTGKVKYTICNGKVV